MELLTYQEELELSDHIYARRKLRKELRDAGQVRNQEVPRTPEEQEIWDRGKAATTRLVEFYTPFACVLARGVLSKVREYHLIEYHELVSVAILAMMDSSWAFDPRGSTRGIENPTPEQRMGLRFSSYCKLRVLKDLHRYIHKQSTPYAVSVDVISSTWAFLAIQEDMEQKSNGTKVTVEDVEEATGISADYIEARLPTRHEFYDVETIDVADRSSVETLIAGTSSTYLYNGVVIEMLNHFFKEESVQILTCYMGIDVENPREPIEVAQKLGLSLRAVNQAIVNINDAMRHPQTRLLIREYIDNLIETQCIEL